MTRRDRITPEELRELFGHELPMKAFFLIEKAAKKGWPLARLRCELHVLAGKPVRREDLDCSDIREWPLIDTVTVPIVLAVITIAFVIWTVWG